MIGGRHPARPDGDLVSARHLKQTISRERGTQPILQPSGHNEHSGATLTVTTANLAGVHIGGSRATAVTSNRHGARLPFESVDEPSADSARVA
jgi:hypothetical protein